MLPRTESFLAAHPDIWDDGGFAFESRPNQAGSTGKEAVLSFFGDRFFAAPRSGVGGHHELRVTERPIHEIEPEAARRGLVQLLANDLHMFSCRKVERAILEELAGIFFAEMGVSRTYSNTSILPADQGANCLGSWLPVTRSTCDTLICAVHETCIAYWLYVDDE